MLPPIRGSALSVKPTQYSSTDYIIGSPERRQKICVCPINMLKAYHPRDSPKIDAAPQKSIALS